MQCLSDGLRILMGSLQPEKKQIFVWPLDKHSRSNSTSMLVKNNTYRKNLMGQRTKKEIFMYLSIDPKKTVSIKKREKIVETYKTRKHRYVIGNVNSLAF